MAAEACVGLKGFKRVKCIIDSIIEVAKRNHGLREEYIDGAKVWGDFADIFVIGAPKVQMIVDRGTGEVTSSIAYSFIRELSEEHRRVLEKALEIAKRERNLSLLFSFECCRPTTRRRGWDRCPRHLAIFF